MRKEITEASGVLRSLNTCSAQQALLFSTDGTFLNLENLKHLHTIDIWLRKLRSCIPLRLTV